VASALKKKGPGGKTKPKKIIKKEYMAGGGEKSANSWGPAVPATPQGERGVRRPLTIEVLRRKKTWPAFMWGEVKGKAPWYHPNVVSTEGEGGTQDLGTKTRGTNKHAPGKVGMEPIGKTGGGPTSLRGNGKKSTRRRPEPLRCHVWKPRQNIKGIWYRQGGKTSGRTNLKKRFARKAVGSKNVSGQGGKQRVPFFRELRGIPPGAVKGPGTGTKRLRGMEPSNTEQGEKLGRKAQYISGNGKKQKTRRPRNHQGKECFCRIKQGTPEGTEKNPQKRLHRLPENGREGRGEPWSR